MAPWVVCQGLLPEFALLWLCLCGAEAALRAYAYTDDLLMLAMRRSPDPSLAASGWDHIQCSMLVEA